VQGVETPAEGRVSDPCSPAPPQAEASP